MADQDSYTKTVAILFARAPREERQIGLSAFKFLCQKGCDQNILGDLFVFFTPSEPLQLGGTKPMKINLSPLDTLTTEQALGGLTLRQVRAISSRARRLRADIMRLRKTVFVRHLLAEEKIARDDLLSGSVLISLFGCPSPPSFDGVCELPRLLKELRSTPYPDRTRRLKKIYVHVREHTGQYYDARVADILSALQCPYTENSLKAWRGRHGLTR